MGSLSKCYLPVILKKREGITEFISVIFTLFFYVFLKQDSKTFTIYSAIYI